MSLISKIETVISVLNEVKALKVALGFDENASITDIIAQIKAAGTALEGVTASNTTAASTTGNATSAAAGVQGA